MQIADASKMAKIPQLADTGAVQGVFFALFLFVLTTYLISEKAGDLYSSRRPPRFASHLSQDSRHRPRHAVPAQAAAGLLGWLHHAGELA